MRAFANGLPEGTKFLIGRAIGYQRNGQIDRSVALLNQAAAQNRMSRKSGCSEAGIASSAANARARWTTSSRRRARPNNPQAFASQGVAEMCVNDAAAARRSFARSLELDGNQPKVRDYLRSTQARH